MTPISFALVFSRQRGSIFDYIVDVVFRYRVEVPAITSLQAALEDEVVEHFMAGTLTNVLVDLELAAPDLYLVNFAI